MTYGTIEVVLSRFREELFRRLDEKGYGAFASPHESKGVIDEEMDELRDAVHDNDLVAFEKECFDVAVGAVFAVASKKAGFLRTL